MSDRVLLFAGPDYEDLELWYPKLRLEEAGFAVTLAGDEAGASYKGKHGYPCENDAAVADVRSEDFAAVVCPGGWMPDKLRRNPDALRLLREFDAAKKPVAAVCHGGWLCCSAGIYGGVTVTGSPGIKDDCVNAGATWVDAEVHVDGHHVTSRRPGDLPAFLRGLLGLLGRG